MGVLEDVIKALERIPAWKRLNTLPEQISTLEARVRQLEEKLVPASGNRCPSCGVMAYRLVLSRPEPPPWGEMGAMEDVHRCSSCSYENVVKRSP